VAEATRASILSSANWPSPRRTNKVALWLPCGTNNAMICDCNFEYASDTKLTLGLKNDQ
jgi:hypothetical protein